MCNCKLHRNLYLFTYLLENEVNMWLNRQPCQMTAFGAERDEVSVWNNADVSVTIGIHPVILKYKLQLSIEYRNFPLS
jgi:hypothetical protein